MILAQVQAAIKTHPEQAASALPELETDEPWPLAWARAEVKASTGQLEQGSIFAEQALGKAPNALRPTIAAQWATHLMRSGDVDGARSFIQPWTAFSPRDVETLARIYIELGLTQKLRQLVDKASSTGWSLSPTARHIDAVNALGDGDARRAYQQLEPLTVEFSKEMQLAVHAAYAAHLLKDSDSARRHLESAIELKSTDAALLMNAAKLSQQERLPQLALDFAYLAHRTGFGDEAIHMDYLGLYLTLRTLNAGNLVDVEPETAVQLRPTGGSEERWLFLTKEPILGLSEFALDSEVARKLLSRRLGETVSLRPGSDGDMKITAVLDRYAYVATRILPEYGKRFPTGERVRMFTVDSATEEVPAALIEFLQARQRSQSQQQGVKLELERRGLPAAAYAAFREQTALDFWMDEITTGSGLPSFNNAPEDRQAAEQALEHGAVLDISTLIGLDHADLLTQLPQWLPRLVVSQHLYSEVSDLISHPAQTNSDRLRQLLDFLDRHAEVVPAPGTHDQSQTILIELLPVSSRSSVLAASHVQLPLLTEDVWFRQRSQAGDITPSVPCCGTIELLHGLHDSGRLAAQQGQELIFRLAHHGYARYPVDRGHLQRIFEADIGQFGDHLRQLIRHFTHPGLHPEKRADTLALTLQQICIDHRLFPRRRDIAAFMAEQISQHSDWKKVLQEIINCLRHYFRAMPESRKEIMAVFIQHFEAVVLRNAVDTSHFEQRTSIDGDALS